MADEVGWNNMRILFDTSCDKWHEQLWGRRKFCCTNDCQYQQCGKSCARLGMNGVEENEQTQPKRCTIKTPDGEEYEGLQIFCCKK